MEAICNVTLQIAAGDYVAVIGPNGSGKTTLIRAILNLVPLAEGSILVYGTDSRQFRAWNRIGYVPQVSGHLHAAFPGTATEIVASGLLAAKRFPRLVTARDRRQVGKAMELVGIEDLGNRRIGELSGGQQQRVYVARALVNEPDLLLMDEPTAAIDPDTRERFFQILKDLNATQGKAVVLVTHDSVDVGQYAHQLVYLDKHLVFAGSLRQFCASPEMTHHFGAYAQHLICGLHGPTEPTR
jgi:zinc transport system ATP-binding protein